MVSSDTQRATSHTGDLALVCLGFALAAAISLPAIVGLSHLYSRVEFYGHAYLMPLVVAYLIFGNRKPIRDALRSLEPPRLGALLVFGAGMIVALAVVGDAGFVAGIGIPLLLGSTAFAMGGTALVRPLALPLVFLALMVPPPHFVIQDLLPRLKLLVTDASVGILHVIGMPVYAEGNLIHVPEHTLFVADACAGLTSIVTMLPIACVVAYFQTRGLARRAFVVLSVIPLAMGANLIRVVSTVYLVDSLGPVAAQGALHESFGVATYIVGTLAIIGVARLVR